MKKYLIALVLVFMACNGWGENQIDRIEKNVERILLKVDSDYKTNEALWKTEKLNDLLYKYPELQPIETLRWGGALAVSEYCPYCGAFTYYHQTDKEDYRKCCRCGTIWKTDHSGNYYNSRAMVNLFQ